MSAQSQHIACRIVSAQLQAKIYRCDLARQKALLIVSRLGISVLVQSVNYADWFICLRPLEEIRRTLLEYKWQFMLRSLMGQRECVFHSFSFFPLWKLSINMWKRRVRGVQSESKGETSTVQMSTLQSSQHCPWAHTASSLRVQVVALQHGFTHSWNVHPHTHTHTSK